MSVKEASYEVENAGHTHHGPKHLVHSHAHEEDVPGTVNLRAIGMLLCALEYPR